VEDVITKPLGAANFAVSEDGSLAYVPGTVSSSAERSLVWVDRQGQEEILEAVPAAYETPRVSPDGRYVAMEIRSENPDVMVYDLERNTSTRLTFDEGNDGAPVWSESGDEIYFRSDRNGPPNLYRKSADGTGAVEQLTQEDQAVRSFALAPDGKSMAVTLFRSGAELEVASLDSDSFPVEDIRPLVITEFNEGFADISPDGKWIAYQSDESGQHEIYVRPFPDVDDGRWQISQNGGAAPIWGVTGQELFYRDGRNPGVVRVPVDTSSSFRPGNPETLFTGPYRAWLPNRGRSYDLSPDGERFLMIKESGETDVTGPIGRIVLVQNWFEELKDRVPLP
jgi:serine/threonine-protein kinase